MKRAFAALACAAVLVALLPATMIAAPVLKLTDHSVEAFCQAPFDGGYASAGLTTSTSGGDGGVADVWLDPAVPFEEPATMSGTASTVDSTESPGEIVLTATFPVFDTGGVELGDATLSATMVPVGDPEIIGPESVKTNHHSTTHGTIQGLEGSMTLSLPGLEATLSGCSGSVIDIEGFETNPHSFVSSGSGVILDCFWQVSDDTSASFFSVDDDFGFFADASLSSPDLSVSGSGSDGSLSAAGVSATIPLTSDTGDPYTAVAEATLTPIGGPVTSTLISEGRRTKTTQQALAADGTLTFDTGVDPFIMDSEHCRANTFDSHTQVNMSSGPKPGAAPANDAPDGAVRLASGSRVSLLTGGTTIDPEVPNVTCPQGPFDAMGHTVWYTIVGTGAPVTIDTSGSDFDTVAAAYEADGGALTEIACIDDVDFVPIGGSYQAVLTFDTELGVEYHVQVGGLSNFFTGEVESGRLRIVVR